MLFNKAFKVHVRIKSYYKERQASHSHSHTNASVRIPLSEGTRRCKIYFFFFVNREKRVESKGKNCTITILSPPAVPPCLCRGAVCTPARCQLSGTVSTDHRSHHQQLRLYSCPEQHHHFPFNHKICLNYLWTKIVVLSIVHKIQAKYSIKVTM